MIPQQYARHSRPRPLRSGRVVVSRLRGSGVPADFSGEKSGSVRKRRDPRTARTSADYWYEEAWKRAGKCVFCDLKEKYIIAEKNNVVLTVNLYQYIDGHLMVIPRRHFESLDETNPAEWRAIFYLLNLGVKRLQERLKVDNVYILDRPLSGFKTGKTVAHSHFHIIPYKPELVSWHYQKINIHPEDLAKKLR